MRSPAATVIRRCGYVQRAASTAGGNLIRITPLFCSRPRANTPTIITCRRAAAPSTPVLGRENSSSTCHAKCLA